MTLIVVKEGVIYADDLFMLEQGGWHQRREKGKKLFLTHCKRVAVAVLGQTFSPDDIENVIMGAGLYALRSEWMNLPNREEILKLSSPEETLKDILFNNGATSFVMLTKRFSYKLDKLHGLRMLPDLYHHVEGTGGPAFNVCMKAGLSVENAYRTVKRAVTTVGDLSDIIRQEDLAEIKPFEKPSKEESVK